MPGRFDKTKAVILFQDSRQINADRDDLPQRRGESRSPGPHLQTQDQDKVEGDVAEISGQRPDAGDLMHAVIS